MVKRCIQTAQILSWYSWVSWRGNSRTDVTFFSTRCLHFEPTPVVVVREKREGRKRRRRESGREERGSPVVQPACPTAEEYCLPHCSKQR